MAEVVKPKRLKHHSPILQLLVWGWKLLLSYAGGASALRISLQTGLLALILGWAPNHPLRLYYTAPACLLVTNAIAVTLPCFQPENMCSVFLWSSLMQTDETHGGRKKKNVRDQEFIWKNECTNDVCNLQKYGSEHEKKREGRTDKKKNTARFHSEHLGKIITKTQRMHRANTSISCSHVQTDIVPQRNGVLKLAWYSPARKEMPSGGDTAETEQLSSCARKESQHYFFPRVQSNPRMQKAAPR